jgi:hypothetical protein
MTVTTFEVYLLEEMSNPVKVASVPHGLENVEEEHLVSFFTQQCICYLTRDVFYFFKLSDDKKKIIFREEYPSVYFGVEQFTNVTTINIWRGVAFIKTGFMTVHYFDFTAVRKPVAVKLQLPNTGFKDIVQIKTFGLDMAVAVRYGDGLITVFDVTKQKMITSYYFRGIRHINYDFQSNQFIVMLYNGTAKIFDCRTFAVKADLKISSPNLENQIYQTGTNLIAIVVPHQIFFYDIKSYYQVTYLNAPAHQSFFSMLRMSNLVMTKTQNETSRAFELHQVKTNNPMFCHNSCRHHCSKPFVPCKKFAEAYISLFAAIFLLIGLIAISNYSITAYEKIAAQRQKMSQNELNELKHSMISRNPMGASILIKERRSMRKRSRSRSMVMSHKNSRFGEY